MSALTAGRVAQEWSPGTVQRGYAQAASTQVYNGGLVVANASGYAIPAVSGTLASGTGYAVLGVAQISQLSATSGTTGANPNLPVHAGIFNFKADSAFAKTTIGFDCYIVDDQTVSMTSTNHSVAGKVADVDSNGNPFVKVGIL